MSATANNSFWKSAFFSCALAAATFLNCNNDYSTYTNYCDTHTCERCVSDDDCYEEGDPCDGERLCSPQSKVEYDYPDFVCPENEKFQSLDKSCLCLQGQCRFD